MNALTQLRHGCWLIGLLALSGCGGPDCTDTDAACAMQLPQTLPSTEPGTPPPPMVGPGSSDGSESSDSGDPDAFLDQDGDGFTPADGDCNDRQPDVHPDAVEICDNRDNDCNGTVDDGLGFTLVQEIDYLAEGSATVTTYSHYDTSYRLALKETDSDTDGVIDTAEAYHYAFDGLGRLAQMETDVSVDATIDRRKTYDYDALGRLWQTTEDTDMDGLANRTDTFIYDSLGRRSHWEMDTTGDGVPNSIYTYLYDASGTLTGLVLDRFDTSGNITSSLLFSYEYMSTGKLGRIHVDLTADGVWDNTTTYVYDTAGRVAEVLSDLGRDGVDDSLTGYVYNPSTGALEKIEIDLGVDGSIDTQIARWEECWD